MLLTVEAANPGRQTHPARAREPGAAGSPRLVSAVSGASDGAGAARWPPANPITGSAAGWTGR